MSEETQTVWVLGRNGFGRRMTFRKPLLRTLEFPDPQPLPGIFDFVDAEMLPPPRLAVRLFERVYVRKFEGLSSVYQEWTYYRER